MSSTPRPIPSLNPSAWVRSLFESRVRRSGCHELGKCPWSWSGAGQQGLAPPRVRSPCQDGSQWHSYHWWTSGAQSRKGLLCDLRAFLPHCAKVPRLNKEEKKRVKETIFFFLYDSSFKTFFRINNSSGLSRNNPVQQIQQFRDNRLEFSIVTGIQHPAGWATLLLVGSILLYIQT